MNLLGAPAADQAKQPWARWPSTYVYPGEVFASADPHVATTILGTCVAVCLCDPEAGLGGLNHFLLPEHAKGGELSARFATVAVRELVWALLSKGAVRARLQAKIFGGMVSKVAYPRDLGTRNVQAAMALLAEEEIPLAALDVGSERGCKLVYQTHDGQAWVKHL